MIDIHSHIIPEVDDGAASWDESLAMCQIAANDGTETIVATPHAFNGVYAPTSEEIQEKISELKDRMRSKSIMLNVLLGAELHAFPELGVLLEKEAGWTINSHGRYFLLEFPHSTIPPHADRFVASLRLKGLIPIVVHPERNLYVQSNLGIVKRLVEKGAFCQITALSVTGGFGAPAHTCAHEMLREDLVHAIASDAHNSSGRPPVLSEARAVVTEMMGEEKSHELFELFPTKVLNGEL